MATVIVKTKPPRRLNAAGALKVLGMTPLSFGGGSGDNRIQLVTNGVFAADANWTKTTWTIGSGVASIAGAATDTMTQAIALTPGVVYLVTFTITAFTGGTVTPILGGTSGTARSSAATFVEYIKAGSTNSLINMSASGATLSIDNVTVVQAG